MLNSSLPPSMRSWNRAAAAVCVSLIDITCRTGLVSSRGCNVTNSLQFNTFPFGLLTLWLQRAKDRESIKKKEVTYYWKSTYFCCPVFSFFSFPSSVFTAAVYWFHAVKQEVNCQPQQRSPAYSRFSLALIPACLVFDILSCHNLVYTVYGHNLKGGSVSVTILNFSGFLDIWLTLFVYIFPLYIFIIFLFLFVAV